MSEYRLFWVGETFFWVVGGEWGVYGALFWVGVSGGKRGIILSRWGWVGHYFGWVGGGE